MARLERCTREHFLALRAGQRERMAFGDVTIMADPPFPAWAWVSEDGVVGCGGMLRCGADNEIWLWLSDEARARPLTLARLSRAFLRMLDDAFDAPGLVAWIGDRDPAAMRFALIMGFYPSDVRRVIGLQHNAWKWRRPSKTRGWSAFADHDGRKEGEAA